MAGTSRRRLNAINSVAWAGSLGAIAVIGLAFVEHDLAAAAYAAGFVLACAFLGMVVLSGRSIGAGALAGTAALGSAGFWIGPLRHAIGPPVTDAAAACGLAESFASGYVVAPVAALVASLIVGILLGMGTACGRIGVQSVLAGLVAGACLIAPGEPGVLIAAAGLLWSLIMLLSIASWARDHALRLSDARSFVRLGQEGPLATLARGSTQQPG